MKSNSMNLTKLLATILTLASPPVFATPYSASAVPFDFVDISLSGTTIPELHATDDDSFTVPIGFNFSFFGNSYANVDVTSNGLLTFGGGLATSNSNTDLTTAPALPSIAVMWDDLHVFGGAVLTGVFTDLVGAPGSREFIVQWNKIRYFMALPGDTITFQARLSEADGSIFLSYLDLEIGADPRNDGALATVGIKDFGPQGVDRLLLAFNEGPNAYVGTGQSTLITDLGAPTVPESGCSLVLAIGGLGLLGVLRHLRSTKSLE